MCPKSLKVKQTLDIIIKHTTMNQYNRDESVPTDKELLFWGWTTLQISQLRRLETNLQRTVLEEYIRKVMENGNSSDLDF